MMDGWMDGYTRKYFHIDHPQLNPLSTPWIAFEMVLSRTREIDKGNLRAPLPN
jgi:hypothetical protein